MKCKQAQASIALWVGDDLEQSNVGELERHVTVCPCCREFWKEIQQSQQALQQAGSNPVMLVAPDCHSLWEELSDKIDRNPDNHSTNSHQPERFNGWMPAFAVVSACLLLLLYSHSISQVSNSSTEPTLDVYHGFTDATVPSPRQYHSMTPVYWNASPPPHRLPSGDSFLPPLRSELMQTPVKNEFKQTAELPSLYP